MTSSRNRHEPVDPRRSWATGPEADDLDNERGPDPDTGSRAANKKRLRPFRRHEVLHRSLYSIDVPGPGGAKVRYTVDIDLDREDMCVVLFADGRWQAEAATPASFPVPGGVIEVDVSLYGVTRVHLVRDTGEEQRLAPVSGTIEDLRGRLHRQHPAVSRVISWLAIVTLSVSLVLAVPQGLELITGIPKIADNIGTFTSPISLPSWLNTSLLVAGVLAAVERLLMLRENKLLDADTLWTNL